MRTSRDRILVTHVGSLPRGPQLNELLVQAEGGELADTRELDAAVHDRVAQARCVARDGRRSARGRLDHGYPPPFLGGGDRVQPGALHEGSLRRFRHAAGELNTPTEIELPDESLQRVRMSPVTGDDESRVISSIA